MFKFMSKFTFQNRDGYLYRRAGNNYYSPIDLGKEIESSKQLVPIAEGTELSEFILSLQKSR